MTVPIDGIILFTIYTYGKPVRNVNCFCLLIIHNDRELTAVFAQIHCKRQGSR